MQNNEFNPPNGGASAACAAQNHEAVAEALLQIEQLALDMISCPEEKLAALLGERQRLIERVEALQASCAACAPAETEEELERVRRADEQALAAVCRIREVDCQVLARMERARERILQKLRSIGRSSGAKAARYYRPTSQTSVFNGSV